MLGSVFAHLRRSGDNDKKCNNSVPIKYPFRGSTPWLRIKKTIGLFQKLTNRQRLHTKRLYGFTCILADFDFVTYTDFLSEGEDMDLEIKNVTKMPETKIVNDTDSRIEAFTKAFLNQLYELSKKKNLPESMQFEGVNCTREFNSGDSITFRIIFKGAKA